MRDTFFTVVLWLLVRGGDVLSRVEDLARRASVRWDTFTGTVAARAWGDLDGVAVREWLRAVREAS